MSLYNTLNREIAYIMITMSLYVVYMCVYVYMNIIIKLMKLN